jgi:hypothetical protein
MMLETLRDDPDDVIIVKEIEHVAPHPSVVDHSSLFHDAELVRHCGLTHAKSGGKVVHAHLRGDQCTENSESRGISEHAEKIRDLVHLVLSRHLPENIEYDFSMNEVLVRLQFSTPIHEQLITCSYVAQVAAGRKSNSGVSDRLSASL